MAGNKLDNGKMAQDEPLGGMTDMNESRPSNGSDNAAADVVGQVQETGRELASRSIDAIGGRARAATSAYKTDITSGLHTLADGLRQTSSTFMDAAEDKPLSTAGARYIDDLASKIENVSDYFERKDPADLVRDIKVFAKKNPAIFVGGAFALGFAISRLARSSAAVNTASSSQQGR